jgi:hypothetical protein
MTMSKTMMKRCGWGAGAVLWIVLGYGGCASMENCGVPIPNPLASHPSRLLDRVPKRPTICDPCFGYRSTCWRGWPEYCLPCPSPGEAHTESGVPIRSPAVAPPSPSPAPLAPSAQPLEPRRAPERSSENFAPIDAAMPVSYQTAPLQQPASVVRMCFGDRGQPNLFQPEP